MTDTDLHADALTSLTVERLSVVLAGQPPAIQAAALGECMAIWLAGHIVLGNPQATDELREELLGDVIGYVRQLVTVMPPRYIKTA